ncbi:MAG: hypothetical protein EHM91_00610 [Planctomycetota bacterium]|nr:MAG: hypothetical protein EHM91_00610 [Planctomycetota bacterium]
MKHSVIVGAALGILAASSGLQAQDGNWVEIRFHRIHLLNGNFIDGNLIGESDRALTMKLGSGEMTIRKDMIERNSKGVLKVEYVKMRSFKEAPKLESIRQPKGPAASVTPPTPTPKSPPSGASEAVTLTGSVEEQLAQAADILKNGTPARKKGAIQAMATLGAEAATMIAGRFATLEEEVLSTATSTLTGLKEASILPIIRPLTGSERPQLRENAALLVGVLGNLREDADRLRGLVRDQDKGVRGAAIVGLRSLNDVESFELIGESLADPDAGIRARALVTLGQFSQQGLSHKLAEVLGRTLEQVQGDIRMQLLKEAAQLTSKDLGPLMVRLSADSDPLVRSYAIMGLGRINNLEHAEFLLERFGAEREYWPRIQLAGAVQSMRLQKAIDPLIEWLGDDDANIRAASMRALRGITGVNPGADKEAWDTWRKNTQQNK